MDAIASHLVLPNRLTIPLVANLHVAQLRSPLPRVNVMFTLLTNDSKTLMNMSLSNSHKRTLGMLNSYTCSGAIRFIFCNV